MSDKRINIYLGASSMRTCLGNKAETFDALAQSVSGLKYAPQFGMYAGVADVVPLDGFTRFESLLVEQIDGVVGDSGISLSNKDVLLLISTTKGNVNLLADDCEHIPSRAFLYTSALAVADHFNAANKPIVISNACISGVSAFVVAKEMILSGKYRHIIVAGGDALCEFITSGFASFKSISPNPCRPYDAERDGLNLGEAAGAILLTTDKNLADRPLISLVGGAISNDANHISGPSRTGDGLFFAIDNALSEAVLTSNDIGFVNAHGTATRYNDEMESKAIAWADLTSKPLNSFKGYIGHTLGASGVVETILCARQLQQGYIYGTKGFVSSDTPHKLTLSADRQTFGKRACVKTASGFGGCNAAIVLDMNDRQLPVIERNFRVKTVAEYSLPQSDMPFADFIRSEFKAFGETNMKFYKMSDMSKALYVAVEKLLAIEGIADVDPKYRAIVLSGKSASLDSDADHQHILNMHNPEGASPAVFVYTLANVAAGEMCIRHKIQGDNTFFIENKDSGLVERYAADLIETGKAKAVISGWCDYLKGTWNVKLKLMKSE